MVSHFSDPEVAGVYCHQVPRPDCSPFLKERLKSWVRGEGLPTVRQVKGSDAFWALHPTEFWWLAEAHKPVKMYGSMTEDDVAEIYQEAYGAAC